MFAQMLIILGSSATGRYGKGGHKPHMRKYLALSGNTEIVYYSNYRLGSQKNREDMEREIRQRYSVRDAREILDSIDCAMRDYSD